MKLVLQDNGIYSSDFEKQDGLAVQARSEKRNPAVNWMATISQKSRDMSERIFAMIGRVVIPAAALEGKTSKEITAAMIAFNWSTLRYEHVETILNKMQDLEYDPRTINLARWVLRGVAKHARMLKMITVEEYLNISEVKGKKGSRISKGRHISDEEVAALFRTCKNDGTKLGKRDAAMIALLIGAGLRRDELHWLSDSRGAARIDLDDESVTIIGKGNRERKVYLFPGAIQCVQDWLEVRGDDPEMPLFPAFTGHTDKLIKRSVSTAGIYGMMRKRCLQAGIRVFKPHDCRHTFITTLLESGADLAITQQQAGHSAITTTVLYDRRGEKVRKAAAQKCSLPIGESK